MQEHNLNLNKGWQCPKCQKVFAPWVPECTYCLPVVMVPSSWPVTTGCRCGTTIGCPIHQAGTWTVTSVDYETKQGENS